MNDNDIIKAIGCCIHCSECSYEKYGNDCVMKRDDDIIALVNRQKAEIEKFASENLCLKDGYFQKRYEEDEHAELLALRKAFRKSGLDYIELDAEWEGKYKTAKAEAIKEFAEKLKAEIATGAGVLRVSTIDIIDNLVKEMTEE